MTSLNAYEEYERERMAKYAWYVCGQVSERIHDAPMLKEYIQSRVSEPSNELFFFNSANMQIYRNSSEKNKMKGPGLAYFNKIERLSSCTIFEVSCSWNFAVIHVRKQKS